MVALVGAGIAAGSLAGAAGGELKTLTTRFTLGLLLSGAGFLVAGLVPTLAVVLVMFTLAGFGNGLMLVHERLFIQETVPDELTARVFGVRDATTAWGFGVAFVSAGALVSLAGPQTVIVIAGAGRDSRRARGRLLPSPRPPGGGRDRQRRTAGSRRSRPRRAWSYGGTE